MLETIIRRLLAIGIRFPWAGLADAL